MLSVSSRVSDGGGTPASSMTAATSSTRCRSSRLRADRLTATDRSRPRSRHVAALASALRITTIVSARMSPVCSAMVMNSSGRTRPRRGWFQRTSASAPRTMPVASSTLGWKQTSSPSLSSASRRSAASARRRGRRGVVHRVVQLPAAAVAAGGVGRDVGPLHQRWRVDGLLGVDGDADVDAQRQQHALGLERRVEAGDEQAGRADHLVGVGHVGHDDGELLAAQAGQRGGLGQQAPDAAAGLDEQAVGAAVAEGVDHLAERVEVDDDQARPGPGSRTPSSERRLEQLGEQRPGWAGRSAGRAGPGGPARPPPARGGGTARRSRWRSTPGRPACRAGRRGRRRSGRRALRLAWVTTSAPTTERSVPVIGAARAPRAVRSRSHGGRVGVEVDPARARRRG